MKTRLNDYTSAELTTQIRLAIIKAGVPEKELAIHQTGHFKYEFVRPDGKRVMGVKYSRGRGKFHEVDQGRRGLQARNLQRLAEQVKNRLENGMTA